MTEMLEENNISSAQPSRSSSTLLAPSPLRSNESQRTIGSNSGDKEGQRPPSSNGSWVIADAVAPTRLLDVDDVAFEVFSFLSFHETVALRLVGSGLKSLVDSELNYPVLLSTLKVRRGKNLRGAPREWPEGQSLEKCRHEVAEELESYDWTEDRDEVMREDRRDRTSLMVVVVESQRRGLRGFPEESVAVSGDTCEGAEEEEEGSFWGAGDWVNADEKKQAGSEVGKRDDTSSSSATEFKWGGIRDPPPLLLLSNHQLALRSLDDVPLEGGTMWASPWEVYVEEGVTDSDGWSYAMGYNATFMPSRKMTSMVRRREHRRRVVMMGSP